MRGLIFMPIPKDFPELLRHIRLNDDPELVVLDLEDVSFIRSFEQEQLTFNFETYIYSSLQKALSQNTTLQYINLVDNRLFSPSIFEILEAVQKNNNLRVLKLKGGILPAHEIPRFVKLLNQTTIQLFDCCGDENKSFDIMPLIKGPEDTIPAGRFVRLSLSEYYYLDNRDELLGQLFEELAHGTTITHLELTCMCAKNEEVTLLALLLESNQTIKALGLADCDIDDNRLALIARALGRNHILQRLDLGNNNFTDISVRLLADLFSTNKTIEAIRLANCPQLNDISNLMQVLEKSSSIKELSFGFNDGLNRDSIIAINHFLEKNNSCEKLDLSRTPCIGKELFSAMQKNTCLTSINLGWCNPSSLDSFPTLAECIANNRTLKEIELDGSILSLDVLNSLRDTVKHNFSLIRLSLRTLGFIEWQGEDKRDENEVTGIANDIIAEINVLLIRNQVALKVSKLVRRAEEKLNESTEENSKKARAIYQNAFAEVEKFKEQSNSESNILSKIVYRSLINSCLRFDIAAAWGYFREVSTWDVEDTKIYYDLADSYYTTEPPPTVFSDNKFKELYQFILLLLAKAGNSRDVINLIRKVFHALKSGRNPKDFLTVHALTGSDVVINLNILVSATCHAKDFLNQWLEANPNHSEFFSYQQHYDLLDKIIKDDIFDDEIISILTRNSFIKDQLRKNTGSDRVAILQQMILHPQKYFTQPLEQEGLPQNPQDILRSLSSNQRTKCNDIFNLSKTLEEELYKKLSNYYGEENKGIEIVEIEENESQIPPAEQKNDISETSKNITSSQIGFDSDHTIAGSDEKALIRQKINRALIGDGDTYLNWMRQHAKGIRGITRFSHWYHGESGAKRARELLNIANDDNQDVESIKEALAKAIKASSIHKHSLSRYLIAEFIGQEISSLQELPDKEFTHMKNIISTPPWQKKFISL
jgi:Ran GTPase-activating protein (RanGAP) involved in mRNA processing and transport